MPFSQVTMDTRTHAHTYYSSFLYYTSYSLSLSLSLSLSRPHVEACKKF